MRLLLFRIYYFTHVAFAVRWAIDVIGMIQTPSQRYMRKRVYVRVSMWAVNGHMLLLMLKLTAWPGFYFQMYSKLIILAAVWFKLLECGMIWFLCVTGRKISSVHIFCILDKLAIQNKIIRLVLMCLWICDGLGLFKRCQSKRRRRST